MSASRKWAYTCFLVVPWIRTRAQSSFVITSNQAVDEWLGLLDDPVLGNSALDRLASASYQIVIEGTSYRQRVSPHWRKEDRKGALTPPEQK